jgi:hypothetical protein
MKAKFISTEKIQATLDSVNGRAKDHTFSDAEEVLKLIGWAEADALKLLGSKKSLRGLKAVIKSGEAVPNAYKYTRTGTQVTVEWTSSSARITEISRCDLWKEGGGTRLVFTQEQDTRAVQQLRKNYTVAAAPLTGE